MDPRDVLRDPKDVLRDPRDLLGQDRFKIFSCILYQGSLFFQFDSSNVLL